MNNRGFLLGLILVRRKMKKLLTLFFLILTVVISPRNVLATSINNISQSVSTAGNSGDYICGSHVWDLSDPTYVEFNECGSASALIDVTESTAYLETIFNSHEGYSDAEIIFQPFEASFVDLSIEKPSDHGFSNGTVKLVDLTTSEEMLVWNVQGDLWFYGEHYYDPHRGVSNTDNYQNLFSVDQSHTYLLSTYVEGREDWGIHLQSSISLVSVPEPATMLLFGTCLAGLAGIRRRKKA